MGLNTSAVPLTTEHLLDENHSALVKASMLPLLNEIVLAWVYPRVRKQTTEVWWMPRKSIVWCNHVRILSQVRNTALIPSVSIKI